MARGTQGQQILQICVAPFFHSLTWWTSMKRVCVHPGARYADVVGQVGVARVILGWCGRWERCPSAPAPASSRSADRTRIPSAAERTPPPPPSSSSTPLYAISPIFNAAGSTRVASRRPPRRSRRTRSAQSRARGSPAPARCHYKNASRWLSTSRNGAYNVRVFCPSPRLKPPHCGQVGARQLFGHEKRGAEPGKVPCPAIGRRA